MDNNNSLYQQSHPYDFISQQSSSMSRSQHPETRSRVAMQDAADSTYIDRNHGSTDAEDGMSGASDFVRKLFRMLEDPTFASIVCWGAQRDCFIVKDMTEFTKVILPRLFKHSNFASFVRQLNKYDFHKVKNTDENAFGEHCWTFRHPKFRADHLEGLEDIKRKSAPTRKSSTRLSHTARDASPSGSPPLQESSSHSGNAAATQLDHVIQSQNEMKSHILTLEANYKTILDEMVLFQRNMATQDSVIQNLMQYILKLEQNKSPLDTTTPDSLRTSDSQFVPSEEAQRMMSGTYNSDDVARASFQQLAEMSKRASRGHPGIPVSTSSFRIVPSMLSSILPPSGMTRQDALTVTDDLQTRNAIESSLSTDPLPTQTPLSQSSTDPLSPDWFNHEGLQVLTVGHLLPRSTVDPVPSQVNSSVDDMEEEEQVMPSRPFDAPAVPASSRLRIHRKTYVPGWSVPPRVLLVEDDAVSRKLSSKFLQVLGVTTDIAVDGDAAVKQMSLEHYDLVLMDIVMPRLDGVSATSIIRQFDHRTPIISMTSNSCPQDILNYYSHGMNDILPKPFTKEGLLGMLEKHLNHLKAISQLSQLPRMISDDASSKDVGILKAEENSLLNGSSSPFPWDSFLGSTPTGQINPMPGLGVPDEQYASILQNMTGDLFTGASSRGIGMKRSAQEDERLLSDHPSKRGRFEPVD